jgi:hypothetical protein
LEQKATIRAKVANLLYVNFCFESSKDQIKMCKNTMPNSSGSQSCKLSLKCFFVFWGAKGSTKNTILTSHAVREKITSI